MKVQLVINFILTFILLNIYFTRVKYDFLYDNNLSGFGSKKKTKTGCGIIFSFIVTLNLFYILIYDLNSELFPNRFYVFLISVFLLSVISFYDDLKPLDPRIRLIAQTVIIYFSLTLVDVEYFDLPLKIMIFIYLIFWIYITNITNFIDGSDGFLAVNSISFFFGIVILDQFYPETFFSYQIAIIFLPVLLSFIFFNKPKAKLYMGDTGSVLIGYVIGFCLLELITTPYWYLSICLYSYPILDCSITLLKKILSGKSVFKRDFDYYFLKPIKKSQNNNFKIIAISIIYNLINLLIIFLTLYFVNPYLVILSIILSIGKINIFNKI